MQNHGLFGMVSVVILKLISNKSVHDGGYTNGKYLSSLSVKKKWNLDKVTVQHSYTALEL